MEFITTAEYAADPCLDVLCRCRICQAYSQNLKIFKNNFICESCLDYIKRDIPLELQIPLEASPFAICEETAAHEMIRR